MDTVEKLLAVFIIVRMGAFILVGLLIVVYLAFLTIETIYVSHAFETAILLAQKHNKEIEDAFKEFNGVTQK